MTKRGQTTLFIIIGVLVLLSLSLIYYISLDKSVTEQASLDTLDIEIAVKTCVSDVSKDGLYTLAEQGGYYLIEDSMPKIYYINDTVTMPSDYILGEEMKKWIEAGVPACVEDVPLNNIDLVLGEPNATVSFEADSVRVLLDYEVNVFSKDKRKTISKFIVSLQNPYKKSLNAVRDYLTKQSQYQGYFCVSCLINMSESNDLYAEVERINASDIIISVLDYSTENDFKLLFREVFEKSITFENTSEYTVPVIPDLNLSVGETWNYNVPNPDNIVFSDYTDLFNITPDGEITFTASKEDIGEHEVLISASKDDFDVYTVFMLNIKK